MLLSDSNQKRTKLQQSIYVTYGVIEKLYFASLAVALIHNIQVVIPLIKHQL